MFTGSGSDVTRPDTLFHMQEWFDLLYLRYFIQQSLSNCTVYSKDVSLYQYIDKVKVEVHPITGQVDPEE
jgi:hypothetical protein